MERNHSEKIFGFAEFLVAVALFVVVYTITDVRFRFRVAITPRLYIETFFVIIVVAIQTLLTDIWYAENWWVPKSTWITKSIWQGLFGALFFAMFLAWLYYGFIRPPVFGRRNARQYAQQLYRLILRGNDEELKIVADELTRSARNLIFYSRQVSHESSYPTVEYGLRATHLRDYLERRMRQSPKNRLWFWGLRLVFRFGGRRVMQDAASRNRPNAENYAYQILLLIANRNFCRQIVLSAPGTAQAFFGSVVKLKKYQIPIGQFARNITSEAVLQRESFLYVEDDGFSSGLLGYVKPISRAIYGNFELVESLAGSQAASPLDTHYQERSAWAPDQLEAYCRAVVITFEAFVTERNARGECFSLNRAISDIEECTGDLYTVNGSDGMYKTDPVQKLRIAMSFIKDAVKLMGKVQAFPFHRRRVRGEPRFEDITDQLALAIFNICFHVSSIRGPADACWMVHHNMVWGELFRSFGDSDEAASDLIGRKVSRLLFDEIVRLEKFPNFKGAAILGYCLNVCWLGKGATRKASSRNAYAFDKAVKLWAKRHYLALRAANDEVADYVLFGSVGFDGDGNRLFRSYLKGLNKETPKDYLELDPVAT